MSEQIKKNVPEIRFKGFLGEWEEFTLGEIGSVAMNKRIFKHQTSKTGSIPFYKIGTFGGRPDSFISRELFEEYKNRFSYPKKGDLLISASGSIGKIVEYKGEDEYFQDSNIVWLKHDGKVENLFLKQFYSFVKWNGLEGSTIKRLYNKNILDTNIKLPESKEQTKIGTYFKALDRMIELHQRKHDKLLTLKQAMLQKMFPQPGATTPEIRFKGFVGKWEEKKLGDEVREIIAGGDIEKCKLCKNGRYPVIANSLQNDGFLGFYANEFRVEAPAVTVTGRGDVGHAVARDTNFTPVVRLLSIKSSHDIYFLEKAINNHQVLIESTGVPQLTVPQLAQYKISFPNSLEEQQKIGSYFRKLDELISQHATQLEKLKQIKTACLAKMFV